jgi:uncharacterized ferredoxin-like protein
MPIVTSKEGEREALLQAARFMLLSARTAPKSAGIDDILTVMVRPRKNKCKSRLQKRL